MVEPRRESPAGAAGQSEELGRLKGDYNPPSVRDTSMGAQIERNELPVDAEQIEQFVRGMFANVETRGYVQMRCFQDDANGAALTPWRAAAVDPEDDDPLGGVVALAKSIAQRAASNGRPVVFAPPVVLLSSRDSATERDVAAGVALSVDIDQGAPAVELEKLEGIIGPPTSVDHSGGYIVDTETGERHEKLHAHWRLARATEAPEEHEKLKRARHLANIIIGGDTSNNPLVHPIRWPGSWHRKAEPVLSTIRRFDFAAEINLDDALAMLEIAAKGITPSEGAIQPAGSETARRPADEYIALGDQIRSGESYHEPLVRTAAKRAAAGMDERSIREELQALMGRSEGARDERWGARYDDIPRIVRSAMQFRPESEADMSELFEWLDKTDPGKGWEIVPFGVDTPPDLSHDTLALDLSRAGFNKDARYVSAWGKWLFWSDSRWQVDDRLMHMTATRDFLRAKANALIEWGEKKARLEKNPDDGEKIEKWARNQATVLKQGGTVASVENMARSNADLVATADQFDSDPMLLGTPGGTVDLRTGELLEAERGHWITKHCSVTPAEPGARAERWEGFLLRVFDGDQELIDFLQRAAGYALTGRTTEHKLLFLYGTGRNGKSVFLNTLFEIMGDYAKRAPAQTFLDSSGDRHPTDLAGLMGARLVAGSELPPGKAWNESVIKDLTGEDVITARFMRQDFFEYVPQFTLFIAGNHQPAFRGIDEAIRARVVLVPFAQTIPKAERDPELPEKLKAEWPQILRWMITGAIKWQERGLDVPESVQAASDDYLENEDTLGEFIEENITENSMGTATVAEVYARFERWQRDSGISQPWSRRAMSQALRERGFESARLSGGTRAFRGMSLKPPPEFDYLDRGFR